MSEVGFHDNMWYSAPKVFLGKLVFGPGEREIKLDAVDYV
jgi:hypothetical protein